MQKQLVTVGLILVSGVLAGAWTWRVESHQSTRKTIKFAYLGAPEDARHESALLFKRTVESESNGALQVELYYGGQLGGDRDAIEGVKLGTIEMTVAGAGIFANFEPTMGVTALPFLFESFEEAWAFNDSDLNAGVTALLQKKGIRVLGHWDNGFRCITNSALPIDSPADLRGLRIRTPENPLVLATMESLGANPSPLPWPELYMALQQRAFDGQENPIPTIYVNKVYEVQTYLSLTNHVYEPMPVVVSELFWKGLSEREKTIIEHAARRSQEHNRRLVSTRTVEMLSKLEEEGMVVSRPDRWPFAQATAEVPSRFSGTIGAELIENAYRFVKQYRESSQSEHPANQ